MSVVYLSHQLSLSWLRLTAFTFKEVDLLDFFLFCCFHIFPLFSDILTIESFADLLTITIDRFNR